MNEKLEHLRIYLVARRRELKRQAKDLDNESRALDTYIEMIDCMLKGESNDGLHGES